MIRHPKESEHDFLHGILYREGMELPENYLEGWVYTDDEDDSKVLGFIHVMNYDPDAHIDENGQVYACDGHDPEGHELGGEDGACGHEHVGAHQIRHAYIAPIVVVAGHREEGIGKALVDKAFEEYDCLRLVSEGRANGFYESLGFDYLDWDQVAPEPKRDCDFCSYREDCHPQPYIGYRKNQRAR